MARPVIGLCSLRHAASLVALTKTGQYIVDSAILLVVTSFGQRAKLSQLMQLLLQCSCKCAQGGFGGPLTQRAAFCMHPDRRKAQRRCQLMQESVRDECTCQSCTMLSSHRGALCRSPQLVDCLLRMQFDPSALRSCCEPLIQSARWHRAR